MYFEYNVILKCSVLAKSCIAHATLVRIPISTSPTLIPYHRCACWLSACTERKKANNNKCQAFITRIIKVFIHICGSFTHSMSQKEALVMYWMWIRIACPWDSWFDTHYASTKSESNRFMATVMCIVMRTRSLKIDFRRHWFVPSRLTLSKLWR